MRSPRQPKTETASQKRERLRLERAAQKIAFVKANPNPFQEWRTDTRISRVMVEIVESALERSNIKPTWQKDAQRNPQPLTARDLAIAFWAVKCKSDNTKNRGLNYGELSKCFEVCDVRKCHRAKAAALLRTLIELDLIRQVKNYSTASGQGSVYEELPEGQSNRGKPRRVPSHQRVVPAPLNLPSPSEINEDPF